MLYRMDPAEDAQNPTDHQGILEQLRQHWAKGLADLKTFCRRCGAQSVGVTMFAASGSPRRRYEDAEGGLISCAC